jgi:hypothetical protein
MMFDIKTFGKLPIAFQVMLGFVLSLYGAKMLYDTTMYAAGDYRFVVLFLSVGVLYIVAGAPSLIEGIMIMYNDRTKPAADGVPE